MRARIAWKAGLVPDYLHHLKLCERWFRPTGTPALIAKCERLAELRNGPTRKPCAAEGQRPRGRAMPRRSCCERGRPGLSPRRLRALEEPLGARAVQASCPSLSRRAAPVSLPRSSVVELVHRAIDVAGRNARALARVVDDILDVSRIVTSTLHVDLTDTDFAESVRAALEAARPLAMARDVQLKETITSGGVLRGDGTRLHQVVSNLLPKALKFANPGRHVQVTLEQHTVLAHGGTTALAARAAVGVLARTMHLPLVFSVRPRCLPDSVVDRRRPVVHRPADLLHQATFLLRVCPRAALLGSRDRRGSRVQSCHARRASTRLPRSHRRTRRPLRKRHGKTPGLALARSGNGRTLRPDRGADARGRPAHA